MAIGGDDSAHTPAEGPRWRNLGDQGNSDCRRFDAVGTAATRAEGKEAAGAKIRFVARPNEREGHSLTLDRRFRCVRLAGQTGSEEKTRLS
jgi:hypothetical protein